MSYSLDFRKRVLQLKEEKGMTFEETSQYFGIGIRTLFRWQRKIEPCQTRNKPATKIDMEALAKDIVERPDDYQYERAKRFGVSATGICLALKRLKVSRKKNTKSSSSRRKFSYSVSKKN